VPGGTLVSDQASQASWNIATAASATAALRASRPGKPTSRADLPKIDVPVLVIQGDADRILSQTGQRLPGLIKDMQLVVTDGGAHAIAWIRSEQVNQALLTILNNRRAQTHGANSCHSYRKEPQCSSHEPRG
jgi:non-heme chloroperoxidase